jgi:hypothetical protein
MLRSPRHPMMQRPATKSPLRVVHRAAALLVACVFATLPTLSRLHDHLLTSDNVPGFRLSKNIERPHERHMPTPLLRVAAPSVGQDRSLAADVADCVSLALQPIVVSSPSGRAPPAR